MNLSKYEKHSVKVSVFFDSLRRGISAAPDILYQLILGLYLLSQLFSLVAWNSISGFSGYQLSQALIIAVLLFLGIYTASILLSWIHQKWAYLPIVIITTGLLVLCTRMRAYVFDGLMIGLLILCSYGKQYTRILKLMLGCTGFVAAGAAIGTKIGYTREVQKVGAYGTGLSFGFVHPNVWGSLVLVILLLVWYLYITKRSDTVRWIYYGGSWILGIFMIFIPKCRTAALLMLLFPAIAGICRIAIRQKTGSEDIEEKKIILYHLLSWLLIFSPVICFLLTIILGQMREWLVIHTFGTYIENFSKRFIQSGLAFKEHGFPLFGEYIRFNAGLSEQLGGHNITLYVMDNAYSTYAILRGMIWLIPVLIWLCYAGWKAVKKQDYAILAILVMFSLLGLMERHALDVYNFVYLYPLTIIDIRDISHC